MVQTSVLKKKHTTISTIMYKWQIYDKQAYSVQQATSHSRGGTKREMQFQLQIYMIT